MKRIAIDFDQTIFNRKTGQLDGGPINRWFADGHEITIFTARPDSEHSTVKALLNMAGIKFDRIICGKPRYDLFIDDKAVKFEGWHQFDENTIR